MHLTGKISTVMNNTSGKWLEETWKVLQLEAQAQGATVTTLTNCRIRTVAYGFRLVIAVWPNRESSEEERQAEVIKAMSRSTVANILDIESRYKKLSKTAETGRQPTSRDDVENLAIDIGIAIEPLVIRRSDMSRFRGRALKRKSPKHSVDVEVIVPSNSQAEIDLIRNNTFSTLGIKNDTKDGLSLEIFCEGFLSNAHLLYLSFLSYVGQFKEYETDGYGDESKCLKRRINSQQFKRRAFRRDHRQQSQTSADGRANRKKDSSG